MQEKYNMTEIRPIKSETDYHRALNRISALMDSNDGVDSSDELDVLTTLVEAYESEHYPVPLPDPVDALLFRMEQQNLTRADLATYMGGRSKVSQVLSRKRPLTLKMIRALHTHLGIPAEVLIGESTASLPSGLEDVQWHRFPLRKMVNLEWIANVKNLKDNAEVIMSDLIRRAGGQNAMSVGLYRKSTDARRNALSDSHALQAWCLHVLAQARQCGLEGIYVSGAINTDFLRDVARLSVFRDGPRRASEFLAQHGIAMVCAQHLPKTYLDGAAMHTVEGVPVVGMTLRYDRIDSFWFCLCHELAHLGWHLKDRVDCCIDDFDLARTGNGDKWTIEDEADGLARDAHVPEELWTGIDANDVTPGRVIELAHEAEVHPAIVAGRVRWETGNYHRLSQFVGSGKVRDQLT